MKPTRARTLARITFAIASTLAVPMPALVATDAAAQLVTPDDRCQADLAQTARKYLERVLKARIRCENKVIDGDLPLATDCLFGMGDEALTKQLLKAQARLSVGGRDCNGVNLQLLGFPNLCQDDNGPPFDTSDFKECVLERTEMILDELLDYYYPPFFERQRGDVADCLKGTPEDGMDNLIGKIRSREKCLIAQAYEKIPEQGIDCYEKIQPYGGGTGDEKTDEALARADTELLGNIPKACAITNINDLDYQDKCPDLTGGNFNIFDLKNCLFNADRVAALAALGTVFPTEGVCGNGQREGEEECDNGVAGNSDTTPNACRTNCTNPVCSDGVTDSNTEECDDGNANNSDCCLNTCVTAKCGDGAINCGETCDNGTNNGTGPGQCRPAGFPGGACKPARCSDGIDDGPPIDPECDDGNTQSEDGCSALCFDEFCGDEIIQAGLGEQCDNGVDNADVADACRESEPHACQNPRCGDGIQDTGEGCDDGNTNNTDTCSNTCTVLKIPKCGDGVTDAPTEQCDDGPNNSNTEPDACRGTPGPDSTGPNACMFDFCGDGVTDTDPTRNETCDDGNSVNTDSCRNDCGSCGDGAKQTSEECDGDSSVCGGGEECLDDCTCLNTCPTKGELVLYAGIGKECTSNTDCDGVGVCDPGIAHCRTVTRLDSGWIGLAHDADINDEVLTRGNLSCEGHGPTCGECEVTGIDPVTDTCRCSNDSRKACDDKFDTAASDCGACVGGQLNGQACSVNGDCTSTCARRCSLDARRTCTSNADCLPAVGYGTCGAAADKCANGGACTSNADCGAASTCTGSATCNCFFGAPFPLASGGTPACIVNRFSQDVSGTANVDLGAGSITAKLRTQVHFGIGTRVPCPPCGGLCSNATTTFCIRDEDCPGGTCNDDPIANDGNRQGVCAFGNFVANYEGLDRGKPCDKSAFNSSFPAYTSGPNGGWYSLDCMPFNNVSGSGLIINLTQTTGPVQLDANVSCTGLGAELDCPCLVCSNDATFPCNTDAECTALQSTCTLGTGGAAAKCLTNADCTAANGGTCNTTLSTPRCTSASSKTCTTNADCNPTNLGACRVSTCSAKGSGEFPLPNQCIDQACTDNGDGTGICTTGPDALFCAGVLKANGKGVLSCQDDDGCSIGAVGVDARPCNLLERNGCFPDPIIAEGDPDPSTPIGAAVFCIPPTGNTGINAAAGLPGPGRVVNQAKARTFCGNDENKQYIPGVGGCAP